MSNFIQIRNTKRVILFILFILSYYTEELFWKFASLRHWSFLVQISEKSYFEPIQDGSLRGSSRMGWGKKVPIPKICQTYPTMMKLGTVTSYLKKFQKIYKSRETLLEICWHQYFFTRNQKLLLYEEIQI